MKLLLLILLSFSLSCGNPTASNENSTIGNNTDGGSTGVTISGSLSFSTDDSTQTQTRTLDWSALTFSSSNTLIKYQVAIGYDNDSDGFDTGDIDNTLAWSDIPGSSSVTSYQIIDGTDSFSITLTSSRDYYFSVRAVDSESETSNIISSSAWQTLAVPLWYSNLVIWLDASDTTTLFQNAACSIAATTDADPIQCWQDKSGNDHHALDTAEGDPLNKVHINGLNTVDFNGTDGLLITDSTDFTSSVGFTQFIIFESDGNTANQTIMRGRPNGAYGAESGLSFEILNNQYTNTIFEDTGGNALGFSSLGTIPTTPTIYTNQYGNGGTTFKLFQNGTDTGLATDESAGTGIPSGSVTSDDFAIGFNEDSADRNLRGEIGEIILYTVDLSDPQRDVIEGYLACKWALQGSLSAGHPYKSTCP